MRKMNCKYYKTSLKNDVVKKEFLCTTQVAPVMMLESDLNNLEKISFSCSDRANINFLKLIYIPI